MTDGYKACGLTADKLYGKCNGHNGWQLWDRQIRQQSVNAIGKLLGDVKRKALRLRYTKEEVIIAWSIK